MKLLIDTNVILDIFLKREPFFPDSYRALKKVLENADKCFFSATAVTDIFYVLRKHLKSAKDAKAYLSELTRLVEITDVLASDVMCAMESEMNDFEDAVVDSVALRIGADYILTRNVKDFFDAKTRAVTPTEFLTL